ncbi:hypothetical protein PR048_031818 [Dryococelus australis]|uniref:Uncharacterized protein n=1 Tax=Dryococelus australis TaxID=614101 RepID=A0ABQ9G6B9_9NEOP|nr:hypothetical protein PR048_031818 [Dryococelus australis]
MTLNNTVAYMMEWRLPCKYAKFTIRNEAMLTNIEDNRRRLTEKALAHIIIDMCTKCSIHIEDKSVGIGTDNCAVLASELKGDLSEKVVKICQVYTGVIGELGAFVLHAEYKLWREHWVRAKKWSGVEWSGVKRFGRFLTSRSSEPMRAIEVNMERLRNEGAGEMGYPQENLSEESCACLAVNCELWTHPQTSINFVSYDIVTFCSVDLAPGNMAVDVFVNSTVMLLNLLSCEGRTVLSFYLLACCRGKLNPSPCLAARQAILCSSFLVPCLTLNGIEWVWLLRTVGRVPWTQVTLE